MDNSAIKFAQVAVIIPAFNNQNTLREAVDSVIHQQHDAWVLCIVDDGSTDNTLKIAKEYALQFPHKIIYLTGENQGVACARNRGIKHTQSKYIAFLDADDFWKPNHLFLLMRYLEENPNCALVHSQIMRVNENGEHLGLPYRQETKLSGHIFTALYTRKAHIASPTVIIRREVLEEIGLFDEHLTRLGCEDRDLWLRIAKGHACVYVPKQTAYYRVLKHSMSHQRERMYQARLYVMNKFLADVSSWNRSLAYGAMHLDLVDAYAQDRNKNSLREHLIKAFSYQWYNVTLYRHFIKYLIQLCL